MTTANTRVRRIAAAGALAVAAVAVPALAALGPSGTETSTATGTCLAWVGSKTDGQCISYSNGNGINVGTPQFGVGGNPNNSNPNTAGGGFGANTGPMLPGNSISIPLG